MRLINFANLELEEFVGDDIPEYTILSHTWEQEELSFQAFPNSSRTQLRGWSKIKGFCNASQGLRYSYGWVDTCCIDKTNSAELSEAINSMWRWYEEAGCCIVYLADFSEASNSEQPKKERLERCRWFTRGWTLQELLAPRTVYFFDMEWRFFGSKQDLLKILATITDIPEDCLRSPEVIPRRSIAKRMSWASKRQTTRAEDTAYSLLGLFGIYMPQTYGEGYSHAFYRLQLELLRQSDDETIFAWSRYGERSGMLANSPIDFEFSGKIATGQKHKKNYEKYEMTNRGLILEMESYLVARFESAFLYAIPLGTRDLETNRPHAIFLLSSQERQCRRIGPLCLWENPGRSVGELRKFVIRQTWQHDYLAFKKDKVKVTQEYGDNYDESDFPANCTATWKGLLQRDVSGVKYRKCLKRMLDGPKLGIAGAYPLKIWAAACHEAIDAQVSQQ